MADPAPRPTLVELAAARFVGADIWRAEKLLFESTERGEKAECSDLPEDQRCIRSNRITWLCSDPNASNRVTHLGIWLIDAEIDGDTDLEHVNIAFPLRAHKCKFGGAVNLTRSHLAFLDLAGSTVDGIDANGMHVDGDVFLADGFTATKAVDLVGATVTGDLDCHDGHFATVTEAPAFGANAAVINGSVFLFRGFSAAGGASLSFTTIGGDLICDGGEFVSQRNAPALAINSSKIQRNLLLSQCSAISFVLIR